ncbi:MAG: antigen [Verrucomicrobiales bacterium]|nr:antigen [Verrucomicrobiales bacterium]
MKKIVSTLGISLVTMTFAFVPCSQAQRALHPNATAAAAGGQNQLGPLAPARQYVGQQVKTSRGENLGKVEDFVVDLESGRILYAVVNVSGSYRPIPAELLAPGSDHKTVTTQATKQQVESSPALTKEDLAQWSSSSFAGGVYRHFNQSPWWQGDAAAAQANKPFGNIHRITTLANLPVQGSSNEKIGKIQNALLDLKSGRVAFLILNPSDILGQGNHLVAVPPNAFTKGTGNALVTGLDKNTLNSAPKYNNNFAELSQPAKAGAIYSYYGKQPWFNQGLSPTGR